MIKLGHFNLQYANRCMYILNHHKIIIKTVKYIHTLTSSAILSHFTVAFCSVNIELKDKTGVFIYKSHEKTKPNYTLDGNIIL